jgi:membrane protease YdiL (CAAX protease family)
MAIGTAVGLGVSGAFELLARYWRPFGVLEGRLAALLGPLSEAEITLLALSSALGEECFFRLAMQDALGLLPTALLFGLLHTGPPGLLWSAVALVLGLAFGWMMHAGCGLLSVTLAHALINYLSLRRMQWR